MAPLSRKRDAYSHLHSHSHSPTSVNLHVHVHEGACASKESESGNPKPSSHNTEMIKIPTMNMNDPHDNNVQTKIKMKPKSVEVSCQTETEAISTFITQPRDDNNFNCDYEVMTAEFSQARRCVLQNMEDSLPMILQTMAVANERLHGMSAVGSEVEDVSSIIFS